jgi:uncharacterized protein (TIGR02118 family)
MLKVTVLYGEPADPTAFERYYFDEHLAIAARIPNVQRVETAKVAATPDGSPLPHYRIAELWFADLQTLQDSMGSPEGQKTVEDLANFATGGASVFISALD